MQKIGVLALQGAVEKHAEMIAALGGHPLEVRQPEHLAGIEALVLPGGESTTMSRLMSLAGLFEPIRRAVAEGLPTLGTCAGMILLAGEIVDGRPDQRCLGAIDLVVRRNAFGRQVDSFEAPLDVTGLEGGPFPATFIRAPVVERVGDGVDVLATVDDRPVLCRQGAVVVAAFHPELSDDLRLHQRFLAGSWPAGPGPSGPTERETQGPSGPTERETQGPSGPTERETQGPSGPTERESETKED